MKLVTRFQQKSDFWLSVQIVHLLMAGRRSQRNVHRIRLYGYDDDYTSNDELETDDEQLPMNTGISTNSSSDNENENTANGFMKSEAEDDDASINDGWH